MDLLFLKTLNPTLNLVETKHLFFNKYLYRIKINAPGVRRHIYYKGDIYNIITNLSSDVVYTTPLSWQSPVNHNLNNCLYSLLLKNTNLKHRIEHPYLTFYTVTEQDLNNIVAELQKQKFIDYIIEICAPNKNNIDALKNDVILVKKIPSQYRVKVVIKGSIGSEEYTEKRRHLSNYLYNLGDEIYRHNLNLTKDRYYYNSTYFYCTDEKIVTLLKLTYPDLIGKTFRVVQV